MADGSIDQHLLEKTNRWLAALRHYHRHDVHGLENVPRQGPCLLVVNHSFATYDIMLLASAIQESTGRVVRGLGDRLIFKIPRLREWASRLGAVEGNPPNGVRLLDDGHLVLVAPGGMREALRPSEERYQVMWEKRQGFARLAMETQAPVVLAACPKADDLYKVYPSVLTKLAYKRFKVPLPFVRGRGLTLLPKRVHLEHYLSEPLLPGPDLSANNPEDVARFHTLIMDRMNALMAIGVEDKVETTAQAAG